MSKRAILIVLDSVGIGALPDAAEFDDVGANTLGHIEERHHSSPVMVDRAMRHGVESCWRLAGKGVQRQYFGYSAQDKQGMPTNGEFLFAVYEHVKLLLPYDRGRDDFLRELDRINGRSMALEAGRDLGLTSCQSVGDLIY